MSDPETIFQEDAAPECQVQVLVTHADGSQTAYTQEAYEAMTGKSVT